MNLEIFSCGPKTILRDEIPSYVERYFTFLDIARKLFIISECFIQKFVLYKSFMVKLPLFNYINKIKKRFCEVFKKLVKKLFF